MKQTNTGILLNDDFKITLYTGFDFVNEEHAARRHDEVVNFKIQEKLK